MAKLFHNLIEILSQSLFSQRDSESHSRQVPLLCSEDSYIRQAARIHTNISEYCALVKKYNISCDLIELYVTPPFLNVLWSLTSIAYTTQHT